MYFKSFHAFTGYKPSNYMTNHPVTLISPLLLPL